MLASVLSGLLILGTTDSQKSILVHEAQYKGDVVSRTESRKNNFSNFMSAVSELCRISL